MQYGVDAGSIVLLCWGHEALECWYGVACDARAETRRRAWCRAEASSMAGSGAHLEVGQRNCNGAKATSKW